jgi:hypothetical protein
MLFKDKKPFSQVAIILYIVFSLPPVFYVGYKVIKKIMHNTSVMSTDEDFYLENETGGGGG